MRKVGLGSDPLSALVLSEVEWIRMTMGGMREIRWMADDYWAEDEDEDGSPITNVGDDEYGLISVISVP